MKGVLLAGGTGSRLSPLTNVTNKHLLPVYNKPMIYYPLYTLKSAGITDVIIVSGKGHAGNFLELMGSGEQFGMNLSYQIQEEPGGIAQALSLAETFVEDDKFMVILGDNVIEDDLSSAVADFENESGAKIFLKSVENPKAYGVAELDEGNITSIVEKPESPTSDLAVIGAYMYTPAVFEIIKALKPSQRNELEITDVNNNYLGKGQLSFQVLSKFWGDCGESFDSLLNSAEQVKNSFLAKIDDKLTIIK